MNRQIRLFLGETEQWVGTLFFNVMGNRESSAIEYSPQWLESQKSFEIDPNVPLKYGRTFHSKKEGLSVFHGAIADSEPDGWARQVILRSNSKKRIEQKSRGITVDHPSLTSLDYLLAVDDYARIGALRYQDEKGLFQCTEENVRRAPPLIELAALFSATRAVETDRETAADLEYLRGKGTSLGGLRPKCTVMDKDGSLSIGKFPSVNDSYSVTKGEVLALHIAEAAGCHVAQSRIVKSDGISVALIKRFDRESNGKRIPYISAATLLGIEDTREIHTYTEMVDALKKYSADYQADAEELWRRIALNILITNVDDHMRNHGFLHVEKSLWRLSPAFDINPFPDKYRALKTWISEDSGDSASIQLLVEVAPYFGLEFKHTCKILSTVEKAVARWRQIGKKIGMTVTELNAFETAFEHKERRTAQQILSSK